jgi:hypothetical protein
MAAREASTEARLATSLAVVVGWLLGGLPTLWLLADGRWSLTEPGTTTAFFDVQARALLDGSLAVPEGSIGFEAFVVDGAHQMYFGPFPSLLRLPILAVTDALDGRLTALSMLAAWVVAGFAVRSLWQQLGGLLGRPHRVGWFGFAATTGFVGLLSGASVLALLAAWPSVYHEAILWAVALCLVATSLLVRVPGGLGGRGIAVLVMVALAAALTRAPVGLGPSVAMGLLVLDGLVSRWRSGGHAASVDRSDAGPGDVGLAGWARVPSLRVLGVLAAAAVVPVAAWAGVNQARFGTPVGLPMEDQVFTSFAPERQAMLEANDGSYFRLSFIPTTLLAYARPDGVEVSRALPFAHGREPAVVGGATLDELHRTPSLPASMPLWVGAAALGIVAAAWGRPRGLRRLRAPIVGAAAGTAGVLIIGYVASRYLGDFVPLVVPAGIAGAHLLSRWWDGVDRRVMRGAVAVGVVLVGLAGAWVSLGSAWITAGTRDEGAGLLALTEARVDVAERIGPASVPEVLRDPLPVVGPVDTYGHSPNGVAATGWRAVDRTSGTGAWTLRWTAPEAGVDEPVVVLDLGEPDPVTGVPRGRLLAVPEGDGRWHLRYEGLPWDTVGESFSLAPGETLEADLVADPFTQELVVARQDERLLWAWFGGGGPAVLPEEGASAGTTTLSTVSGSGLCDRLVAGAGDSS